MRSQSHSREDDKESVLSAKVEATLENPPDGGWGWVVCLACFYVQVVAIGLPFAFGVIYTTYLDPRCPDEKPDGGTEVNFTVGIVSTDCGGFGEGRGKTGEALLLMGGMRYMRMLLLCRCA
jgi:hypothetical protein